MTSGGSNPTVSIIIPLDCVSVTADKCIRSIIRNTRKISFEIILAGDEKIIMKHSNIDPKGRIVNTITEEKSYTKICNKGLYNRNGKYFVILDPKIKVKRGWLKHMINLMDHDPTIAMVGPKILYQDGKLREAGGIVWRDGTHEPYGQYDDPRKSKYNYVKETDFISAKCLMIRKDVWNWLKGFDTRFEAGGYDVIDLAFQVRRQGFKVKFQPKSTVVLEGHDLYPVDENKGLFYNKWKETLEKEQFPKNQHHFWARDRSGRKKTILMLYMDGPDFDKSTASRMAFHYLTLFVKMDLNVIYAGEAFKRREPYTSILEKMGVEVLCGNSDEKNINEWIKRNAEYIDYAYLIFPFIAQKHINVLRNHTKAKIIYNGCDLFFLREQRNYELLKDPKMLESASKWKSMEMKLIREADVNHTLSTYEKKIVRKLFPEKKVRIVPVFIYDKNQDDSQIKSYMKREGLLFVGTFKHKPNVDGILWFVKNVFPYILRKVSDIKFFIVGSNPPKEIKSLESENIIVTGHVSDQRLESFYKNCRVVVAPLRFGAGVKGKIVEAMRYQVPVVTTRIGAEGFRKIENFIKVALNEKEFAIDVIKLYKQKKLWVKASMRTNRYINKYFSVNAAKKQMRKDIKA
ncbi:glycosyltransferase [Ammoniphilus sp. YIM 78166]|uniref:glycosyltransferase n=1 Tax=Ammoniphilus sp. YIM 78166 TaxID=1644106 RepID=UPI00106F36E5|nr:glycosyltransferase [Ammoniphilus sp. YIM 78166]